MVSFETSPNSANEPNGPAKPNAGANVAKGRRGRGQRVERPDVDARDRRVDRDDRRPDSPEADVEEDEGRDRANGPLVDRPPVESDRHHDLGTQCLVDLASKDLAEKRWRTTLIEPPVEPAEPPTNISANRTRRSTGGQSAKFALAMPVVVKIEIGLEDGRPNRGLALGDAVAPERRGERPCGAEHAARRRAGTLRHERTRVGRRRTNAAMHEREVRPGNRHEERQDPLRLRRERRRRVG